MSAAWGIGRVGAEPWPVSAGDIEDEVSSAVEHLRLLGLGEGGLVLIVSRLSETIHVAPLELAAGRLGARWSSADATPGDAFRAASLTRQLAPGAVIGLTGEVIAALPDGAAAFADVPAVAVRDQTAWDALTGAGNAPRWWLHLGPASAFECGARTGAHYDGDRWLVESGSGGELVITSRVPRLTPSERLATGVYGAVDPSPCPCGSPWPRVVVTRSANPPGSPARGYAREA